MEPEALYLTMFAIYDPIKKCGEFSEFSVLRRNFENVGRGFISVTKCGGRIYRAKRSGKRVFVEGVDYPEEDRDEVKGEAGMYVRFDRKNDAAAFVLRFY